MTSEGPSIFLPPILASFGYLAEAAISRLEKVAVCRTEPSIQFDSRWWPWRGILEYLGCVELAGLNIRALAARLRSKEPFHNEEAILYSTSVIFFGQATLDMISVWLRSQLSLSVKNSQCALHTEKFREELASKSGAWTSAAKSIESKQSFVADLAHFRKYWIHRLPGGARAFCAAPPDRGGVPELSIPRDPALDPSRQNEYLAKIDTLNARFGTWLYSADEFANRFADETKELVLSLLDHSLTGLTKR